MAVGTTARHGGLFTAQVKLDGADLPAAYAQAILGIDVESTFNRPDVCTIRLQAPQMGPSDAFPPSFAPGRALSVRTTGAEERDLFDGEVTSVELDGREGVEHVILRGYDKRHRLYREMMTETFLEMSVVDIVRRLAGTAGLTARLVSGPSNQAPFWVQATTTAGDFVEQLAHEAGLVSLWERGWVVKPLAECNEDVGTLAYGGNLYSFTCRASAESWAERVEVRDWDVIKKKPIVETATNGTGAVVSGSPDLVRGVAFKKAAALGTRHVASPTAAREAAGTALGATTSSSLQLEGTCDGHNKLKVGGVLTLDGVGKRFAGKYRVSWLRHTWSAESDLVTEFACNEAGEGSITSLLGRAADGASAGDTVGERIAGVVPALVTNLKDPQDLGRVKVKYPWLAGGDRVESDWVRVAGAGVGAGRGWLVLPEVNDEVLVAFEHGDLRRGYIVGGLYNGVDKPPKKNSEILGPGGVVQQRLFKSRKGHTLTFDDSGNTPGVELVTGDGNFTFKIEEQTGKVTLTTKKGGSTIVVGAQGEINIKSDTGKVTIEAPAGDIEMKAVNIKLDAKASVDIKGGATAKLEGTAKTEVKSPAMTEITGGIVKIN